MEKEIVGEEVITTIKEDLSTYIENKQIELDSIGQEIIAFKNRQESILAELTKLIK
jgi:hypothetical protein